MQHVWPTLKHFIKGKDDDDDDDDGDNKNNNNNATNVRN